ncbi:DSBA oxidoreductase [Knoellia aerolata DSM 18566]|uniref:DSBA oxidoreductase n=1 Tax=Knoellia aerolata DSM 18566 TaxID=1385519 RepID=A0A0A0K1J6_9MICO|nr:DSBA oxidoreductase [Knoellia aerolata DSM 18566]
MTPVNDTTVVDLWFDPVCPYSWTASRWLHEVARSRPIQVRHHLISLYFLNEHRTDITPEYRRSTETTRGPGRVAMAAATRFGEEVLGGFYTAFGERVFDEWRRPSPAEYHVAIRGALAQAGLPADLEDAMESDEHDEALRRSHDTGLALVGGDVGTPITCIDGRAFYGPVLNAIPRGDDALAVFDGARLLAAYPQFFELKRTRLSPPVFT